MVLDLIKVRRSVRAFSDAEVSDGMVDQVLEAGRWAPSGMNNQPWRFLSFGPENPRELGRARAALKKSNIWALAAPRLIYILARITRPGSDKPNRLTLYEAGMAAAAMEYQAASDGLVFHQMAGFDEAVIRRDFNVAPNFAILVAAAVGKPGRMQDVPADLSDYENAPRERLPLNRLVFHNGEVPSE